MHIPSSQHTSRHSSVVANSAGSAAILLGSTFAVIGGIAWAAVSAKLKAENITVAPDAPRFAGKPVTGPLTAYAQADIISQHTLTAAEGKTFSELAQDDPIRETVMNGSFLRASLFTSIVSFGVAAFAIGTGLTLTATGLGILSLTRTR